ncbi:MAG TPA: tyrosine-type recombinase/integrase [bacterium]|nr:tyrosine-type recombinase/integrase [bacterium]HPP29439.1 tyrosine-type recombinase/integrase [bacterium]
MKTGNLIKRKRVEYGYTIDEIAEKAGISASYLCMIEKGRRLPNWEVLENISEILDLPFRLLAGLLAEETKDEKIREKVAKIRLAELFQMNFSDKVDIPLTEMLNIIKNKYPERYQVLYQKAKEKFKGLELAENELVIKCLKEEPSITEIVERNIYIEQYYGEDFKPEGKLKILKDNFNFTWRELGKIFGRSERSLERYLAGKVKMPENVKEKMDEFYERIMTKVGPLIKSYSPDKIFRKIEEIGFEEELKRRIIKIYPEMKRFKKLPLSLFFNELSERDTIEEKLKKNMARTDYFTSSPRGRKFLNFSKERNIKRVTCKNPDKNSTTQKTNNRKSFRKKGDRKKSNSKDKNDDEDSSEVNFFFGNKRCKIEKRLQSLFDNLRTEKDLRGKEVLMAKIYKPKGRKFWYMRIKISGKIRRISTKCEKKQDAEKFLEEFMKKTNTPLSTTVHTLYEAIDRFIEEYSKIRKRAWERDVVCAKNIKKYFPDMPLSAVTPEIVYNWMMRRSKTSLKNGKKITPRTVNIERAFMSRVFNVAMKIWWWVDRNPVSAVERLPYQSPPRKAYTDEDIKKILNACRLLNITWFSDFFVFLLTTGFRRSEAINLITRDVIFEGDRVFIKIVRAKSMIPQEYPTLFPQAKRILIQHCEGKKPDDPVFTDDEGKKLSIEKIRCAWNRIRKVAGIKGVLHETRHTFATRLRQAGLDPDLLRFLLGQKTLAITYNYIHFRDEDFHKLAEKSGTLLAHFSEKMEENVAGETL